MSEVIMRPASKADEISWYMGHGYRAPVAPERALRMEVDGAIKGIATALPTEAAARKGIPLYSGLIKYFPDALAAVAELSHIGNDQHNPGEPLHWDRSKSTDELDAAARHLWDAGKVDTDKVRHSTKLAWRALANLQKEIEGAR